MWNIFTNILNRDHILDTTIKQDYVLKQTMLEETRSKPKYNNPEIQAIASEFGGLLFAGTLEIELHRLLMIVPRNRKKADAYKALCSELKKHYGVDLRITSSKTKGGNYYGIERQ